MKKIQTILLLACLMLLVGCAPSSQTDEKEVVAEAVMEQENDASDDAVGEGTEASEIEKEVAEYKKLSAEEAKDMMVEGNLIVDVRTQEEYDSGHIEGALLVPLNTLMLEDFSNLPDKNQVLLVYCRSGNRSRTATQLLVEAGYTQVYDFGGINTWPYDLVKE